MAKKVLIVGSGGREYAMAWKFQKEGHKVYCGNEAVRYMGIGQDTGIFPADDIEALARCAEDGKMDLTVVGPEQPLVDGIADTFQKRGLPIFGPTSRYARLEGDKIYASELMQAYGIPTPMGRGFRTRKAAQDALKGMAESGIRVIPKASGLHGGKGSLVTGTLIETRKGIDQILSPSGFNDDVLLQQFLMGREASTMTLVGNGMSTLETAKDYKRVGENRFGIDPNLNTGGMGSLSPNPWLAAEDVAGIEAKVVGPTMDAINQDVGEGRYVGVAYGGIMLTDKGPQVIEWNVRLGDPETQVILMRMKSPLLPYMEAAARGEPMDDLPPMEWDDRVAVGAVIATPGYPTSDYKSRTGMEFRGPKATQNREDAEIFFAGVELSDGKLVNSGGRVAMPVVLADSWEEGKSKLYELLDGGNNIGLGRGEEDTQFRTDIADDAIAAD